MKVLLTGGTGFIGKHTHKALLAVGYRVKLFKGDITKVDDWLKNLEGKDVVIHLAGIRTESKRDFAVNEGGARSLAEALDKIKTKPQTIIFASTQAVYYGLTPPFREDMLVEPPTVYGQSKLEAEKIIFKLPLRAVILRLSAVLGEGVRENSHMSGPLFKWTKNARSNQPIVVFQGGDQTRDYVDVNDVVAAILMAIKETKMKGIYNVAGKTRVRLVDLARKIKQTNKSRSEIVIKSGRPTVADPKHLYSDTSKLAKFLDDV